jgi:hypothetical protein
MDPFETLEHYRALGKVSGGGRYPVRSRSEMREIARLLTLANPKVRQRLLKESENGTMPVPIFIELVRQGWGMAEQKVKVEESDRARPSLRTLKPIGYDPLNPGNPDTTIIEAIYGHVPELPAARPEPAQEPEAPPKKSLKSTIVPRPEVLPQADEAPTKGFKKRVSKRPPDDEDTAPLRVEGV